MIKVTGKRAVRSTTAPYITEDGETTEIAVEYYSQTTAAMKERREAAIKRAENASETEFRWFTDDLVDDLFALPDLADDKGKPFKITVANLDKLDVRNLNAIRKAIEDDIAAKKSQPGE
jgi:hypothetical protein